MGKRGRPPYPDILTPREWEVLDLLRDRLTNEQIAARLGITLDGAKYHVSEILSKLAVRTREEATAWRARSERPWWMRLIALPAAAKVATALALVGSAGVIGALAVASSGGEEEVVQQVATATSAATASPTPASISTATPTSPTSTPEASPQPVPAGWRTYTDAILGFSFPYSPGLTNMEERMETGLEGQENQRFLLFRTAEAEFGLAVVVIPVGDLTLGEWVDFYTACGGDAGAQEEEIVIAGQEGLRCPVNQVNERNPGYFLKWQSYILEITGNLVGSREGGGYLPPVLTEDEIQKTLEGFTLAAANP